MTSARRSIVLLRASWYLFAAQVLLYVARVSGNTTGVLLDMCNQAIDQRNSMLADELLETRR